MAEVPEVSARRLGKEQRFELSAAGDERRWFAVQWAAKPRPSRQELAPWWYEQGRTWHLYREEPELGEPLPPPMGSFA